MMFWPEVLSYPDQSKINHQPLFFETIWHLNIRMFDSWSHFFEGQTIELQCKSLPQGNNYGYGYFWLFWGPGIYVYIYMYVYV